MRRFIGSLLCTVVLFACDPVDPPDEEETPDAGSGSTADAGGENPDPICRVNVSGAVTAQIDCRPSTTAEHASLSRSHAAPAKTTFSVSVPSAAPANGVQVTVTIQYADAPEVGQVRTEADVTTAIVAVARHVDGDVDRQWTASKAFGGIEDRGSFSVSLTAMREDAVTEPMTLWQPTGTLTAHAPLYPGYTGDDTVDVSMTFRPRSP